MITSVVTVAADIFISVPQPLYCIEVLVLHLEKKNNSKM